VLLFEPSETTDIAQSATVADRWITNKRVQRFRFYGPHYAVTSGIGHHIVWWICYDLSENILFV